MFADNSYPEKNTSVLQTCEKTNSHPIPTNFYMVTIVHSHSQTSLHNKLTFIVYTLLVK